MWILDAIWLYRVVAWSYICLLTVIIKKKLATVVEGDQKAPFSIATTPSCRGERYSFPWIAPVYPWYVRILYCWMLSKELSSTIS